MVCWGGFTGFIIGDRVYLYCAGVRGGFLGGLGVLYLRVDWWAYGFGIETPLESGAMCCFIYITQLILAVFSSLYCLRSVRASSVFASSHVLSVGEVIDIHWFADVKVAFADAIFYLRGIAIYHVGRSIQVSRRDRTTS